MIVFKITYDTSVVTDFVPTFNNGWGYDYTTKTSTSGTLKTVTYESDTVFTAISIPNNNRNCVKSIYIDASGMTNLYGTFTSCQSMTDFTIVNATSKLTNLYQTTYDCTVLSNITYQDCDLSGVTNIQNVFNNGARDVVTNATFKNVKFNDTTKSMISILGKATTMVVEDCDFSSITSCYNLFGGCGGLKGTLDLSTYDFTNVYETNNMFNKCTNLTKIIMPKGTFDKITNCGAMFQNCTSLVEVDLSGFHIPNAQNISYMFGGCTSIEEIDCSALGVLNPTNINHMFVSCQKLKRVNLSGIKAPKAISFSHMFYESAVVEWIDISNVLARASNEQNFWRSGTVVKNIGMLYCPADVINAFANSMVSNGNVCNIYYHDAKLEDLTVDGRFNYIYCEEYYGDVVSTPDDLKLHGLSDVQDTLDLTTGTYTQRVKKWNLAEEGYTLTSVNTGQEAKGYVSFYIRQPQFGGMGNPTCILNKATHINNLGLPNLTEGAWASYSGRCLGVAANNAFLMLKLKTTDVTSYDKAGLDEWVQANDFTVYYNAVFSDIDSSIKTETYQVDINPLKSYRNGSITTSSQQLAPTLKTTLPISNKFTTTNLSSGQTYNIYFDGTATKLDAGGTIITNPVSPCEVECGGTTLTIEGTDIQNVRVIETTVKNEVGSVCGTTDVELSRVITSDLEVITDNIIYFPNGVSNNNAYEIDNELGTIFTKGSHNWGAGYFTTNKKYPKGISLLHVEFDVDMPEVNLLANIYLNNNVPISSPNFRDLTLNNDTATVAQGQSSGAGQKYFSLVTKGHYSRLIYNNLSEGDINIDIYTGTSGTTGLVADGNNAEGSVDGYSPCFSNGVTISNLKIKVIENYPDATSISQITSSLRKDSGLTVLWQDMDMSIGQTISKLEQPIKLRSLGTTYDSYNPVTGELTKRIGVSETDGSYSVLSSPVVESIGMGMPITNLITNTFPITGFTNFSGNFKPNTTYTVFLDIGAVNGETASGFVNNSGAGQWGSSQYSYTVGKQVFTTTTDSTTGGFVYRLRGNPTINSAMIIEGDITNYDLEYFMGTKQLQVPPHLYTNGQVKVYSESDVYPTTILDGQSTNNYEISELNTSNNYTIRYEGECESINLANRTNSQGTNRIVKAGATSGNLTFVNDNGDIDNVLLVQNDVREQEINFFNGLQTVEVSGIQIKNKPNIFDVFHTRDFEGNVDNGWVGANVSLRNGVHTVEATKWLENLQAVFSLTKLNLSSFEQLYGDGREETPIMSAGVKYQIVYNISINEETSHSYSVVFFDNEGNSVGCSINGSTLWQKQNQRGLVSYTYQPVKDVYGIGMQVGYGFTWYFKSTISNFTICELKDYVEGSENIEFRLANIDLPQPVQLNSLLDGTHDTYNPITGEYVQNVGTIQWDSSIVKWSKAHSFASLTGYSKLSHVEDWGNPNYKTLVNEHSMPNTLTAQNSVSNNATMSREFNGGWSYWGAVEFGVGKLAIIIPREFPGGINEALQYLDENPIMVNYKRTEPIVTQLTPINIPTFEGGTLQLITTDGKVFPMVEYSMPTNNRYDTSSWEAGKVYTQRNMTEAYFNDSTTPMTPTETMTLTTDHISSGSIILNDNGNGLIVLKGNYTGRDIPYFTGMRSVESIEVEVTPSPDQPLFGKGGRK